MLVGIWVVKEDGVAAGGRLPEKSGRSRTKPPAMDGVLGWLGLKQIHLTQIHRATRLRIFRTAASSRSARGPIQCSGAKRQPRFAFSAGTLNRADRKSTRLNSSH